MFAEATLLKVMRRILQAVATCLGGMGIMALYGSFYRPDCGIDAIMMLSTATLITLGMPRPVPRPGSRRG